MSDRVQPEVSGGSRQNWALRGERGGKFNRARERREGKLTKRGALDQEARVSQPGAKSQGSTWPKQLNYIGIRSLGREAQPYEPEKFKLVAPGERCWRRQGTKLALPLVSLGTDNLPRNLPITISECDLAIGGVNSPIKCVYSHG